MKYGKALQERALPEWTPYNVDYDELKHLIKVNTSRDQGQAIAIPGHTDSALQKFENLFYGELCNQHDRVDLFVKSKADEFSRKLREYQRRTINLIARCDIEAGGRVTPKRMERFARMESKVLSCGNDIKNLEKFTEAQRIAFHKILKKYKKWTGSTTLGARFNDDVLSSPKSFTHRSFSDLHNRYNTLLSLLRSSTPTHSESSTPITLSRRESYAEARRVAEVVRAEGEARTQPQGYWNEYDNGSEAGDPNEPYTIYIDPNADDTFPGHKAVVYILRRAKLPFSMMKGWLSSSEHPEERRPLLIARARANHNNENNNTNLSNGDYFTSHPSSTIGTDTEFDDTSSNEFPSGYEAHYASLPSIVEQKLAATRELLLFRCTIASFFASFVLLLIAGILIATGRHRLRVEVDAGVTVGVVAALFFATLGLSVMLCRWQRCAWVQRALVGVTFAAVCVISGMLLVLVMGNTAG